MYITKRKLHNFLQNLVSNGIILNFAAISTNTIITMDEETMVDQNKVQNQSENKSDNKEVKKNDKAAPKIKKRITTSAKIAVAAFAGGMAARMFSPMKVFPNASVEGIFDSNTQTDESEPAPEASTHLVGHNMPVASEVNDSLSFNEAFAAARNETGPGGLFVWQGHTYGTYYKNEWDAMSQEEQDQYWADVQHTSQQIHYEEPELESESDSELDVEQNSDLGDEQEQDEEPEIESNDEEQELQEDDSDLVEVELDEEADVEVSLDEDETDEIVEVEDEESIDISVDGDDEVEVLVDEVDESDDIELEVETDDELFEDPSLFDADTDEIEEVAFDENEMMETDEEMDLSDDLLDSQEEDYVTENADIDDFASTSLDPEIDIDNDMDMSDFS